MNGIFKRYRAVLFISLVVFGGFFYTQALDVHAQTQTPDLVLDSVSLLGDIAVIYRNDGATVSGQPYVISFQWVDTNGVGLAPKQTLRRNALAARGRETLDWNTTTVEGIVLTQEQRCYSTGSFLRRRTKCDYIQVPRTVNQTLAAYRASRPRPDALLAVMLDDGNRIVEINETNNSAQVGNTPFRGVPSVPPTELVINRATFDGVYLFVAFQNQSAVSISNQPFDVGLQWLDKAGSPLGDRRFFRYKNLASGKVEVIDSKMPLFTLAQIGPGLDEIKTAEPLSMYLILRPVNAAKLSIAVDDRNQILEVSETNNVAVLDLPTPDFMVLERVLTPQGLSFKYVNAGAPLGGSYLLSVWFEWVDEKGTRVGNHLYWLNRDAALLRANVPISFISAGTTVYSSRGQLLLDQILKNPPTEAASLKVTIDGPNMFGELNEINNVALLPKPVVPLPDLAITKQVQILNPQRLVFSYVNASKVPLTQAPAFTFWFEWVDEKGARVGEHLYWQDRGASSALPGLTNIFNSAGVYVYASRGAFASLDSLLRDPPTTATHLKVTIDGTDKFRETDESNNSAFFPLTKPVASKLPDLTITDATLDTAALRFWYHNRGETATASDISLWYELVDAQGKRVGELRWINVGAMSAQSKLQGNQLLDFATLDSERGKMTLGEFVNSAPSSATHLKLTIDGSSLIAEADEQNNSVLLPKREILKLPDLALTAVTRAGGVVKITIVNGTLETIRAPFLQFKWLDAKGNILKTSPVSYWQHETIAPGKTGDFTIEYERWREDGVIYFLKHPPEDAVALLTTIDPENKLKESNEDNNVFRIMLGQTATALLPDLAFTTVFVPPGSDRLVIGFANAGKAEAPTWEWQVRWFDAQEQVVGETYRGTNSGLKPNWRYGVGSDSQDLTGKPRSLPEFLKQIPNGAARMEIIIDPDNKIVESEEKNNMQSFEVANFPPSLRTPKESTPSLTLSLSVEVVKAATAAASSSATAGFLLALVALASGGFLIHSHHGAQGGAKGLFSVFPLLLISSRASYMRLRGCGPEGCAGSHFARHGALKRMTRASLGVVALTGAVKIGIAISLALFAPATSAVFAEDITPHSGDEIRATLTAKNTGNIKVGSIKLTLPCPEGSAWKSTALDGKSLAQNSAQDIAVTYLEPGASHRLMAGCVIGATVPGNGQLNITGMAKATGIVRPVASNTVTLRVVASLPPKKESELINKADLTVAGVGFLPLVDIVEADRAPLEAIFSGIVSNKGKKDSGVFRARVRVDHGSNGTWDAVSPKLVEVPSLAPGSEILVKLPLEWVAPVGVYTFEICADPGRNLDESDETNNCTTDRFTLKVGEEPAQEENIIEE